MCCPPVERALRVIKKPRDNFSAVCTGHQISGRHNGILQGRARILSTSSISGGTLRSLGTRFAITRSPRRVEVNRYKTENLCELRGDSLSSRSKPGSTVKMTNQQLPNLLLVIDRLFIQMNADYRASFSMLALPVGACNE